jgi:hypothetical protein
MYRGTPGNYTQHLNYTIAKKKYEAGSFQNRLFFGFIVILVKNMFFC